MDLYNLRQKDIYNFDEFMDIKKPAFGGPNSGLKFDAKKEPKQLKGWRRVVKRYAPAENGVFNPNYDGQWRAIGMDRASRDAGVEQEVKAKYIDDLKHGRSLPTYESFMTVLENIGDDGIDKITNDSPTYVDKENSADDVEDYENQPFPDESDEMDAFSATEDFQKRGEDQYKIKYNKDTGLKQD
jgi:hypothetical protein